jgi:MFS family permease
VVAIPVLVACVLTSLAILAVAAILRDRPRASEAPAVGTSALGKVTPYLALAFVIHLAFAALQATNAFYVQDLLGLDTVAAVQRASLISMTFAAFSFAFQAFAIRAFGWPPATLLWIGLIVCLLASVACLMAPGFGWLLTAFGFLGAGFAWTQSGLMAGASLASRGDSQGQVAGHLQAAMAAAWIVGPLIGAAIYEVSIKGPLALAAGAMALAMLGFAVRRRA